MLVDFTIMVTYLYENFGNRIQINLEYMCYILVDVHIVPSSVPS